MARLPSAESLGEVQVGNVRQLVRPDAAAFGATGAAMQGLARSVQSAAEVVGRQHDQASEYAATKAFLDFDLENDRLIDEAQRNAPANPTGFSSTFRKDYDD